MKKMVRQKVDYYLRGWVGGVSIEQIRTDLNNIEKMGADEVDIDYGTSYGDPYISIEAYINRPETNEEFELRIGREMHKAALVRENELAELQRLKQKYESK